MRSGFDCSSHYPSLALFLSLGLEHTHTHTRALLSHFWRILCHFSFLIFQRISPIYYHKDKIISLLPHLIAKCDVFMPMKDDLTPHILICGMTSLSASNKQKSEHFIVLHIAAHRTTCNLQRKHYKRLQWNWRNHQHQLKSSVGITAKVKSLLG